jgi:hypothetical protein
MSLFQGRRLAIGLTFGAILASGGAKAHFRDFCFSRDWYLPYRGEREIEARMLWLPKQSIFDQEFEFEYGFTNHFAIEPGFAVHREPGQDLHIDAWDVEFRFNFGEFAYNQILPALNVEYERPMHDEPPHAELKFVLSYFTKDGSDISFNFNVGRDLETGSDVETEITAGWVMPLAHNELTSHGYNTGIRGGFEFMSSLTDHNTGFGPVIVLRKGEHFNVLATYLFGLNHGDQNPDQFRMIGEYEF